MQPATEPAGTATAAAGGLRARKKAATRAGLRAAAVRLARAQGPGAVTVEAICAAVEVSPRTFFNYFAGKDEALIGVDAAEAELMAATLVDRPGGETPLVAVAGVLAEVLDTAAGSGLWHQQLLLLREHPGLVARVQAATRTMEAALAEGLARRSGRTATDGYVATVAAMGMTALRLALSRWLDSPDGTAPRELFDPIINHLHRGLATPAGTNDPPDTPNEEPMGSAGAA